MNNNVVLPGGLVGVPVFKTLSLIALLVMASFAVATESSAQGACHNGKEREFMVPKGFLTGQAYLERSQNERTAYVMGVVDGFAFSPALLGSSECAGALQRCLVGRNNVQLTAIVDKHIRDNPANWHWQANAMIHSALFAQCLKEGSG